MTPQPPPDTPHQAVTERSILVIIDGPADTTRRPRRPSIPYTPPEDAAPPVPGPEQAAPGDKGPVGAA